MKYKFIMLLAVILVWRISFADEYRKKANEGYDYYKNGEYDKAVEYYRQAGILKPDKQLPKLGRGAALYKSKNYEEAKKEFSTAAGKSDNLKQTADMYYNLGNALYRAQDYEGAVKSFVDALKIDPKDNDYKHNLEMAIREQQMQQQQKNNQKRKDNKDQDKQNKQKNEEKKDNKNQQDQEKQDQQKSQQDQQDQQQRAQQQQQDSNEQEMSKEEAEKLLARFEQDEKEIQKRLKQVNIRGGSARDW